MTDQEIVAPERVSLQASQNTMLSPFSHLAQASNLLGRVIRHCNDTSLEIQFVLDDLEALTQAIFSLMELLSIERLTASTKICTATAICFRCDSPVELLYIPR